jgi:protein involved in polysaccharide export with SLBB domain
MEDLKVISNSSIRSCNRRAAWRAGWLTPVRLLIPILILFSAELLFAQLPAQGSYPGNSSTTPQETGSVLRDSSRDSQPGASPDSTRISNYTDTEVLSRPSSSRNQMQQMQMVAVQLPPEAPTEFQKFVGLTTGKILPVFGAELFQNVPSTFAPLDLTPVPPEYQIGPGDELRIRVWGQINFQSNVRVDRSGDVFLPQVGPVHVAGIPFAALDAHLRGAVGRVYHNFDLTADVGQIGSIQVYIAGQARRPGLYTISSLSSLIDALFASGGPSAQGSMRHIELRRSGLLVTDFDLYDLLIHGDKSKDVKLQSGDVLLIPPSGAQVAVIGSVHNPAIYELRGNDPLSVLLSDAGGVTAIASNARISIERIDDHRERHAMEVASDASGLATPMADGDLVRVYSIVPVYRKTVILRGNTANPGRFSWHQGMRLSDLIPDKESLITRNYWWKRAQLGLPAPEDAAIPSLSEGRRDQAEQEQNQQDQMQTAGLESRQPNAQQRSSNTSLAGAQSSGTTQASLSAPRTRVRTLAPEIDWNYAVIERIEADTLKNTLIPFDLGKLVLQHDASQDLELHAGDVISIFSEADIRVPIAQQTKLVTLGGEFAHAGVYTVQPGETLRDVVERAGGLTADAYLYGSEFTRESTRAIQQTRIDEYVRSLSMGIERSSMAMASSSASSSQDLSSATAAHASEQELMANLRQIRATGRVVLQLSPASSGVASIPSISLEDGDHFIVPSVPGTVNVVGSVYNQNSFLYRPGIKAGTYLSQAGGANRDADRGHMFIIRADGGVVSRDKGMSIWSGGEFNSLRMNPGDTIVVPEKTFKPSALRSVVDWSQMFSQFALGAAALSILR